MTYRVLIADDVPSVVERIISDLKSDYDVEVTYCEYSQNAVTELGKSVSTGTLFDGIILDNKFQNRSVFGGLDIFEVLASGKGDDYFIKLIQNTGTSLEEVMKAYENIPKILNTSSYGIQNKREELETKYGIKVVDKAAGTKEIVALLNLEYISSEQPDKNIEANSPKKPKPILFLKENEHIMGAFSWKNKCQQKDPELANAKTLEEYKAIIEKRLDILGNTPKYIKHK